MLFITNRVLNEGPTPSNPNGTFGVPRSISFALTNNQSEQSIYFCRRNAAENYTEIGSLAFLGELKKSQADQILLYVHGYSNLPEPAIFPRTEELQGLFNRKTASTQGDSILVVPLIWPCDNDLGAVGDYFDDQIAADASAYAFARLFQKFIAWRGRPENVDDPCTKRINILSHSMGNRVLTGSFERFVHYFQRAGIPLIFRNIFMASADIVNEALEPNQPGEFISDAARNVVVYFASDDLAMRASKIANVNNTVVSRRMGHTGPEHMDKVAKNVYALDCDDFNTDYDPPIGHGYFGRDRQGNPGVLFDHMWECIRTGRVPMGSPDAHTLILNRSTLNTLLS